jgi:hypothetical protein
MGVEVVVEVVPLAGGEMLVQGMGITYEVTTDLIIVEQPSQDECQNVTHTVSLGSKMAKAHPESHNLALASDKFDVNTLDNEPSGEQKLMKMIKHQAPTIKKKAMRLQLAQVVKAMTHLCHNH